MLSCVDTARLTHRLKSLAGFGLAECAYCSGVPSASAVLCLAWPSLAFFVRSFRSVFPRSMPSVQLLQVADAFVARSWSTESNVGRHVHDLCAGGCACSLCMRIAMRCGRISQACVCSGREKTCM